MNSIVFAGHETTAMTLMWVFYMLSQHPDIETQLIQEIDTVLGDRSPTLDDLDQMPYTHQLIQETLRMYPSVYVTLREAEEDDQFNWYEIPAETQLIMNIRGLHRDPRYWENPNQFDPTHFDPEKVQARHKFAFMPFIAGPKKCIGDAFAMMEMRLVVPAIMQKIRFAYRMAEPAAERAGFVMETKRPVLMEIQSR